MRKELLTTYLKLHLIVLIYGFTAILGKLIELPALELVWYRMFLAIITLFIYLKIKGEPLDVTRKELLSFFGVGLIIALHWVTFYGAIKLSNVSVTLGCFATTTLFTSFLEPFFQRKRINFFEVLIGLIIIAGLYLIFKFETHYALGIMVALLSAFLAGLFTVLNKKLVAKHTAIKISFYEMIGGLLGLSLYITASGRGIVVPSTLPTLPDFFYLVLLATVCTAYAHTVQVDVMKHLSAFTVTLTINLEPVYGIVMAFFIFGETEKMTTGFYLGTLIILLSVIGFPLSKYYFGRRGRTVNQIR
ncbi:MAG: EamA family transporter [Prolixibacteraceae bacterium]